MRVLVVTSPYLPHSYGGYEASCRDVVERWRARGHEVTVLTSTTRLPARPLRERVRVERHNLAALHRAPAETASDVVSFWSMGAP